MVLVLLFPKCIVSASGSVEGEKGSFIEKSLCDSGGCLSVVGSFLHAAIDHVRVQNVPLDPFQLETRGQFGSVKRTVKFGLGAFFLTGCTWHTTGLVKGNWFQRQGLSGLKSCGDLLPRTKWRLSPFSEA